MFSMTPDIVHVDRIDTTTDTLRITTEHRISALADSIREVGLLVPPILAGGPKRYRVVSGYRRIAACSRLDISRIAVRTMSPDSTPLDEGKVAISENLYQRTLNPIELSRAYTLLFDLTDGPSEAARTAGRLGLPDNLEYMENTRRLCCMSHAIQRAILSDTVTLPMAVELSQLPESVSETLVGLFQDLKLSLNRQRETLRMFREIARRDGVPLSDLVDAMVIRLNAWGKEGGSAERSRWLRTHLRRWRYPTIVRTEEAFHKLVDRLRLGEGIKLVPPKQFEGTTYRLEVDFDSPEVLQHRMKRLQEVADHSGLVRILKRNY